MLTPPMARGSASCPTPGPSSPSPGSNLRASEAYAGMEPDFSKAAKGTLIYWDNMSLTS